MHTFIFSWKKIIIIYEGLCGNDNQTTEVCNKSNKKAKTIPSKYIPRQIQNTEKPHEKLKSKRKSSGRSKNEQTSTRLLYNSLSLF